MAQTIYTTNDRRFQNLDGVVRQALNEHSTALNSITSESPATVFSSVADVLANTTDEGDSGNARGLAAGSYLFNENVDMGLLHFVLTDNATYTIRSTNVNTITYTGTLPFITNAASTPNLELILIDIRFLTSAATAIDLDTASSLIMRLTVFVACKKAINYKDSSFMTMRGVVVALCEDGITADNIKTMQLDTMQMSDGPDLGGVCLRCLNACERLIITSCDARPTDSEAYLEIDASYTGTVSITGGTFGDVGLFFKGARNQKDPDILVKNVVHVKNSTADAFGHVAANALETTITTIDTPVLLNAVWTDVDKSRFTFDSAGRWTYTGIEDICINISFTSTIDPVGGGSRDVSTYIAKNGAVDVNTQGSATLSAGGQVTSIGIIDLVTGDYIEPFIENNSGTQNLVGAVCSLVIS